MIFIEGYIRSQLWRRAAEMDTYFAPAETATEQQIQADVEILAQNEVLEGLMDTVGGLLAILNEQRQIITLNGTFLKMLGVKDPIYALGLRPGNALNCVHADEAPGGCGTTRYCSTCGTAKAIVKSLETNEASEETCALKSEKDGVETDVVLKVRSHPVQIQDRRFIMLFLRDITLEQQRAALERTFFHDINNMLFGLVGASQILARDVNQSPMVDIVRRSSLSLQKAVEMQRYLLQSETDSYQLVPQPLSMDQLQEDLYSLFQRHPARKGKHLRISNDLGDMTIQTDISMFHRVLANMITNALEATQHGGRVMVRFHEQLETLYFSVHNQQVIPAEVKLRIFQRNFSTKSAAGRGIGTFSMKLFGEKILGGRVNFTSEPGEGTTFTFSIPKTSGQLVNQYN